MRRQMSFENWYDGLEEQKEKEYEELIESGELNGSISYDEWIVDEWQDAYDTYCDQAYEEYKERKYFGEE